MPKDSDYLMALEMQKRLMEEDDSDFEKDKFKKPTALITVSKKPLKTSHTINHNYGQDDDFLNCTQNLVHPQWETLDPTPDIFALFGQFDGKFFQGRLKCVTLEWSKRMYSCAGICYARRNRFGMDVTIRLSEPLLKLRPRKDLIETLLHEMIHAYCFVLNIREGNGGHGPNFKKIMVAINKVAGTNITVYHTFYDEVNLYKQHWWRCSGVCQDRGPFFGYVKRTSNRAPGPYDNWYAAHQRSCGGTFMKIKGPEKPEKKKKEKAIGSKGKENGTKNSPAAGDLRNFFTPKTTNNETWGTPKNNKGYIPANNTFKGPVKTNGGGTMLLNPKTKSSTKTSSNTSDIAKAFPPSSYPGLSSDPFNVNLNNSSSGNVITNTKKAPPPPVGNLRNVIGFKDLGGQGGGGDDGGGNSGRAVSVIKKNISSPSNWGRGSSLTTTNFASPISSSPDGEVDRNHLRNLWAKRFSDGDINKSNRGYKRPNSDKPEDVAKRRRISTENSSSNFTGDVIFVSDENMDEKKKDKEINNNFSSKEVITLLSDDDDDDDAQYFVEDAEKYKARITKNMSMHERQTMIKQEIVDDSLNLEDDDIELIDDEYDDNISITTAVELADTSIIDEFFGEDTLMADFQNVNDSKPSSSKYQDNRDEDIITCFICECKMPRNEYAEHLNGCEGISKKIQPPKKTLKNILDTSKEAIPNRKSKAPSSRDILRNAGYTEDVIVQLTSIDETEEDEQEFLNNSGVGSQLSGRVNENASIASATQSTLECPVCKTKVEESNINEHLDLCLLTA